MSWSWLVIPPAGEKEPAVPPAPPTDASAVRVPHPVALGNLFHRTVRRDGRRLVGRHVVVGIRRVVAVLDQEPLLSRRPVHAHEHPGTTKPLAVQHELEVA